MMTYLDQFVDTKEKRYYFVLLLTLCLAFIIVLPYLWLAYKLISIQSYDGLFALLNEPSITWTFIARVVLAGLSLPQVNLVSILSLLAESIVWYEVLCFILFVMAFSVLEKKKITTLCLVLLLGEIIGCGVFIYLGVNASSLGHAVWYLKGIGSIIGIVNAFFVVVLILYIIRLGKAYIEALSYQVEEIRELK